MNRKDKQYYIRKAKEIFGMFVVTLGGILCFMLITYLHNVL